MRRVEHDLSNITEPKESAELNAEPKPISRRGIKTLLLAVIFSLLVHLIFVAIGEYLPHPPPTVEVQKPMRATLVSPQPKKNQDDLLKKQVVATAPPKEVKRPKEADYLAEYDQSTKEETRSRVTSPLAPRVASKPSMSPSRPPSQQQDTQKPPSPEKTVERKITPNGIFAQPKRQQARPTPKLFPSWKDAVDSQGMPFNDSLKDVAQDVETKLNTWEWRHATFFNRVKEAVARRWDPNYAIRRHDPTGEMIGKQDRVTQVAVTIDHDGKLISARIAQESGVYYLDDEAMRAFREAAPFSNPPKALFASSETFEFLFGFMVETSKGLKFDVNWQGY